VEPDTILDDYEGLLRGDGDEIPEGAFFLNGSFEDVKTKAADMMKNM